MSDYDGDSLQDLDISWIQEHEKETNIDEKYFREPMKNISVYYIYINNHEIEKIDNDIINIFSLSESKELGISKECILHIIQNKKKKDEKKYKLIDILLYHVNLEPEIIQNYSKSENIDELSKGFFKVLSIFDDILIPDSIFIFHSINSLYFIFQREEIFYPRSILKDKTRKYLENTENEKHNYSKKSVGFHLPIHNKTHSNKIKHNNTKKHVKKGIHM